MIAFYRGTEIRDGALIGHVSGSEYKIHDDPAVLDLFQNAWAAFDATQAGIESLVTTILRPVAIWGIDLNALPGLTRAVAEDLAPYHLSWPPGRHEADRKNMIDSHHHFWRYDPQEYGWISESMALLRRDFLPANLRREISQRESMAWSASKPARRLEETRWLLELAEQNDFIRGVVGWVPLVSDRVRHDLERFSRHAKLKAVRHVLQDEPDDNYVLRDDFSRGIRFLKDFGLRYDILIFERHLPQAIKFVDRHPDLTFILDHVAKPRIRDGILSPWRENMRDLAKRPNVYCKLSGMATEADPNAWTPSQLRPYADVALEAFGARRLMFGSDWPVCLLAVNYSRWISVVREFASPLSPSEQDRLFSGTAVEAYGL